MDAQLTLFDPGAPAAKPAPKPRRKTPESEEIRVRLQRWRRREAYKQAAANYLLANSLCRPCERLGVRRASEQVDHVNPAKNLETFAEFMDTANWQPICVSCHAQKSANERAFARGAKRVKRKYETMGEQVREWQDLIQGDDAWNQRKAAPVVTTKKHRQGLAEQLVERLQSRIIQQGTLAGEKITLMPWQLEVCRRMLDIPYLAVSMPRGNGKTTFFGALAAEIMDPGGCLNYSGASVDFVARSLKQSQPMFRAVLGFLGGRGLLERQTIPGSRGRGKQRWRLQDTPTTMFLRDMVRDARLEGLSSDSKNIQGRQPTLALGDEPREWAGNPPGLDVFNAMRGGMGKQPINSFVTLGVLPAEKGHWFREQVEGRQPRTHGVLYGAKPDDDIFSPKVWREANPAWDYIPELRKAIETDALQAMKLGGQALQYFRARRLNMGESDLVSTAIVSTMVWKRCQTTAGELPDRKGPVCIGIDLGGGDSMSAVTFYWPESGRMECYACYPSQPDLRERGRRDGVDDRYERMHAEGTLQVMGEFAVDNVGFVKWCFEKIAGETVHKTGADRYRTSETREALGQLGIYRSEADIEWRAVGRGSHGFHDVRSFERAAHEGRLKIVKELLLTSAIAETEVQRDTNGNGSINRARTHGRNDALQSAVIATGIGQRYLEPQLPDPKKVDLSAYYAGYLNRREAGRVRTRVAI